MGDELTDEVVVQPGDTVHVAEPEAGGDVDNSFDDFSTDESVNVVVNVEVPDADPVEVAPMWAQELSAKMEAVLALQIVDVIQDAEPVVEEPVGEPVIEAEPDIVEVDEEVKPEKEAEPVTEESETKAKKRKFGR